MRVSASQLAAWKACRLRWKYSYDENLALPESSPTLASGIAVHGAVEAVLKGEIDFELSAAKGEELLAKHLEGRPEPNKEVEKYLPGVVRCLRRMPDWVWKEQWKVEEPIEWDYGDVTVFGIPDIHAVYDDHIVIGEFKSTSNTQRKPLDYFLFNPQHRYYAVLLSHLYPGLPIFVRYAVVHTGKTGPEKQEGEWLIKERVLKATEKEMLATAREIGKLPIVPSYGVQCHYCDFKEVCMAEVGGVKDLDPIKRTLYVPKDMTRE